ncbi:hypothetical protein MKZ08_18950 [Viridibacillus sp. FSL R5-0477]|uniref:hypothetical protein n=1 Tax=Viridibacillus TaxID=496496 RepID=UPI0004B17442|nr:MULTISPECIES: hypothetical protein [Viridibacillus]
MEERVVKARQVDIVSMQLIKGELLLYSNFKVKSLQDGSKLFREFLGEEGRDHFLVKF